MGNITSTSEIDFLTKIHNEKYLRNHYQEYLTRYPDANFVMIDFQKFKSINDTFGHNIGDLYLVVFAQILDSNFSDSIVVRLHGDEYAILTKYSEEEIERRFKICSKKIELAVQGGVIPREFGYNAGSTKAEHGIDATKEKSDYMMYFAKKEGRTYQPFSQIIWIEKLNEMIFLRQVSQSIKESSFSYSVRQLHSASGSENMFQIYTRDDRGRRMFVDNRYEQLKRNLQILPFDIFNVQNILERVRFDRNSIVILLEYSSLLKSTQLYEYLALYQDISSGPFSNVVLSIDVSDLKPDDYLTLSGIIAKLKQLGFRIRLEKLDSKIGDLLWETTETDYIKISTPYWKRAMVDPKVRYSLIRKVESFTGYSDVRTVFEYIETEAEANFITNIAPSNSLFSGNYYSSEKTLILS